MESTNQEIVRYIKLVVEKRYMFIIVSLCVMTIIIFGAYFLPKKYEVKSTIFIERNVIEELVSGIAITPSMDARIRVLRDVMLGRSLILNVMQKLDMDSKARNGKELEEIIVDLQRNIDIGVRNNSLITVSLVDKDAIHARDFINTLVDEYVEKNIFAKREEAYDATKFLDKQVDFFKKKMDKGEEAVVKFRQEKGIYLAVDERSVITAIQNYNSEIERIEIEQDVLVATRKSINKQLNSEDPIVVVTMFNDKSANDTLEALQYRLQLLLMVYTENYPEVIKVKAEIESLKNQTIASSRYSPGVAESRISAVNPIYNELKQKVNEVEGKIDALYAREKKLRGLIKKKEAELRQVPEDRKELIDLEQDRDSYKNVYVRLLERLGQSEVSKQMEIEDKATTFRVIEPAILPQIPVSLSRKMLILAAIAIGFLSGFGLIFALDYLDNSIKTTDSLKSLGLPVLAIIPTIQSSEALEKKRKQDIIFFSFSGVYMLCILCVLALEFMDVTYVENLVQGLL